MSSLRGPLKAELGRMLYLMDSTPIPLKGLGYDEWTRDNRSDRTQGLKVHLVIASGGVSVPVEQVITAANVNDVEAGRSFTIEAGATYVFDKGYCDYNWWHRLDQAGALFVTRLKKNAGVVSQGVSPLPGPAAAAIRADERIAFRHRRPGGGRVNDYHGRQLRRVTVARPDKATPLILVTNDLDRPAEAIAALYRQRWEIELFFKWLKQNLKIKRFVGRSENAVRIQIYTALIASLLVYLYRQRHRHRPATTLMLILSALSASLFTRPTAERIVGYRRHKQRRTQAALQAELAL